jgi:hypothetical protein
MNASRPLLGLPSPANDHRVVNDLPLHPIRVPCAVPETPRFSRWSMQHCCALSGLRDFLQAPQPFGVVWPWHKGSRNWIIGPGTHAACSQRPPLSFSWTRAPQRTCGRRNCLDVQLQSTQSKTRPKKAPAEDTRRPLKLWPTNMPRAHRCRQGGSLMMSATHARTVCFNFETFNHQVCRA